MDPNKIKAITDTMASDQVTAENSDEIIILTIFEATYSFLELFERYLFYITLYCIY